MKREQFDKLLAGPIAVVAQKNQALRDASDLRAERDAAEKAAEQKRAEAEQIHRDMTDVALKAREASGAAERDLRIARGEFEEASRAAAHHKNRVPVFAMAAGKVVQAGATEHGLSVRVADAAGQTHYGHFAVILVDEGDEVEGGDVLGWH